MKKGLIAVLLLIVAFSFNVYSDVNNGLVAYYPFNGNANDASGNGHNGKLYGGVSFTNGKIGKAAYFDGKDDYIKIYSGGELIKTNYITVTGWIKPFSFSQNKCSQNTIFVQNDINSGYVTHDIFFGGDDDASGKGIDDSLWYDNWLPSGGYISSSKSLKKNTWVHFAVVRSNGHVIFYVNGKQTAKKSYNEIRKSANSIDNVLIGARYYKGSSNCEYHGLIDELRIYNRAITESEIQEVYNYSGSDTSCSEYTKADVDAAFEAGKQYCKTHPSECGMDTINYVGECASFNIFTNTLHIPCFNMGKNYWLDLKLTNSNPVQFELSGYGEK